MITADRLTKCFSLAPLAEIPDRTTLGAAGLRGYNLEANLEGYGHLKQQSKPGFFPDTNTRVVRIWADWAVLQERGDFFDSVNADLLATIDGNIQAAKQAAVPLIVILVIKRFPAWSNYAGIQRTTGPRAGQWVPVGESQVDHDARVADLMFTGDMADAASLEARWKAGFDIQPAGNAASFRFPVSGAAIAVDAIDGAGVTPDSPWGRWITFLASRYHPDPAKRSATTPNGAPALLADAWVDVIEFINEPNLECWPQKPPGQRKVLSPRITAAMTRTAVLIEVAVNAGASVPMQFAAPATSDTHAARATATVCPYDTFLLAYANALQTTGAAATKKRGQPFKAGANMIFTHHNYLDIERGRSLPPLPLARRAGNATNSAAWVVRLLRQGVGTDHNAGWWRGWPEAKAATAGLLLTEGGSRQHNGSVTQARRAQRLEDAFNLLRTTALGRGVALFTNFLTWEDVVPSGSGRTDSHLVKQVLPKSGTTPARTVSSLGREPTLDEYGRLRLTRVYDAWRNLKSIKRSVAR